MLVKNFKDEQVYPVSKSQDAELNAFYCDFCPKVGFRPSYASCLNRLNEIEQTTQSPDTEVVVGTVNACHHAVLKNQCMAIEMKRKEELEGQALYFVNRKKLRKWQKDQRIKVRQVS